MAGKSKVLVIGGTGYIGKFIVEGSVKEGHPTFALVRESTVSDPIKGKAIDNFKNLGVQLLYFSNAFVDHTFILCAAAVLNYEGDIGTYTIKAVDEPRTLNKILFIKPPKNTYSFNELVALWEKLIGKTLDKTYVPEEQFLKQIQGFVGVEASELYPKVKYTTVEEYLSRFV
ncbi:phenylcoumaran benzylic ether reductase 1 [Hibiscus trionum]|uniref:Phenylcoumaran benzylic ether reductase 1 n=1 Tax=Hibiscus trionum TaxID=183268 RepID=A0A9W7M8C9_HIBTR|nr:phenylcoumaran benzylic ether reductase 1 [Hibiscus trionum]